MLFRLNGQAKNGKDPRKQPAMHEKGQAAMQRTEFVWKMGRKSKKRGVRGQI